MDYMTATGPPGTAELDIEFPDVKPGSLDQDQEWCLVKREGLTERVRFHDYARIYEIPGLYEELFYKRLKCTSPPTIAGLLRTSLEKAGVDPSSLRVLDLGAGNGMVADALAEVGVRAVAAVDVVPEAKLAAERDRPGLYDEYFVADFTALPPETRARIAKHKPNALTTVAALGFGDIPASAFATAWNLISPTGWVAFNIKEAFLSEKYQYGFSLLIRQLISAGLLQVAVQERYLHRKALTGEPIHYIAIVGQKTGQIPDDWLNSLGE